jgi:hypothetical protein
LFLLALAFGSIVLVGLFLTPVWLCLQFFSQDAWIHLSVILFAVVGVLLVLVWICFAFFFGLTSYFMIPVMYIRRCRAVDAFRDVLKLIVNNIGSFVLFCLFGFCLLLGMLMIGGIATCLTCCLAALPYVGTVILLPVFVCLRAFGLCFIRQFGPEYDVWAAVPSPAANPPPLPR